MIQSDAGRPLSDLPSNLVYDGLMDDCREVLKTLSPKEAEIRSRQGKWFLMRIMPYRTSENVIDGVVITFLDIDRLKQAVGGVAGRRDVLEELVRISHEPLAVLDANLRMVSASDSFYKSFQLESDDTVGRRIYQLNDGEWNIEGLRRLLEESLQKQGAVTGFRIEGLPTGDGPQTFLLNARRLADSENETGMTVLAFQAASQGAG